jgi:oligoendopeptidase F
MKPLDAIKVAGVDLADKATYAAAFSEFEATLKELSK